VRFFFPDSQDFVDPTFDFQSERRSADRLRSRDDRYAHEVFKRPPFDGLLVSKAIVDGVDASGKTAKYSLAQRHRLLRNGVREYFRLDDYKGSTQLLTMGDCGAFSYVKESKPPFSVDEVIDFYEGCGFDIGVSVDHVILTFDVDFDTTFPGMDVVARDCIARQEVTLELAAEFKRRHKARGSGFVPMGVAQGWSPKSYAKAARQLQRMGYTRIALGGMVPLKTNDILAVLKAVSTVKRPDTQLHLLGVTRTDQVEAFDGFGVTSFDTTSPFLRSFKDAKQNYFTADGAYTALRIPQVQGNARVLKLIRAGKVDQKMARSLERSCLERLRAFDRDETSVDRVLDALIDYDQLVGITSGPVARKRQAYQRTLEARPWKQCSCEVCQSIGVDVIIFRGSERNKRRGFHNLYVLYERLHRELSRIPLKRRGRRGAKESATGNALVGAPA
jgi:hypothetical protein